MTLGPWMPLGAALAGAGLEPVGTPAPADPAHQGSPRHDQGIGQFKKRQGEERCQGHQHQGWMVQGASAHAPGRLQHDRQHCRLEGPEHSHQQRQLPPEHIDAGEGDQQQHRGHQKQAAGDQPPRDAMHQPAQIGGQLDGLGAWQNHAVIQGMQIAPLREPAAPLHQLPMHQGNLTRRSSKAHQPQLQPEAAGGTQAHGALLPLGNNQPHSRNAAIALHHRPGQTQENRSFRASSPLGSIIISHEPGAISRCKL